MVQRNAGEDNMKNLQEGLYHRTKDTVSCAETEISKSPNTTVTKEE